MTIVYIPILTMADVEDKAKTVVGDISRNKDKAIESLLKIAVESGRLSTDKFIDMVSDYHEDQSEEYRIFDVSDEKLDQIVESSEEYAKHINKFVENDFENLEYYLDLLGDSYYVKNNQKLRENYSWKVEIVEKEL